MRLKVSNVCQLLDKSKYPATHTENGITWTNNLDGAIIANGTLTANYSTFAIAEKIQLVKNHKYALIGGQGNNSIDSNLILRNVNPSDYDGKYWSASTRTAKIVISPASFSALLWIDVNGNGYIADNITFKPQLFDLTEMYGVGNEPTTVAQFRQDFPNEMYEYSPVCWKKFRRLKYVTETKNLMTDEMFTSAGFTKQPDGSWYVPDSVVLNKKVMWENTEGIAGPLTMSFYGRSSAPYYAGVAQWLVEAVDGTIAYRTPTGTSSEWVYGTWTFDSKTVSKVYWVNISNRPLYLRDVMFEWGSTPTPYQPYGYLPLNRGKYIANKEPVQLLDKSKYPATSTSNGITYTKNEDGSYDVNGTVANTGLSMLLIGTAELVAGHIYLNNGALVRGQKSYVECKFWIRDLQRWVFPGYRFQCGNYSAYAQITLLVNQTAGTVISDEKLCPELFDLTEMYGAGNEPTAEEFWATYQKTTMYDYNPYNAITFR